MQQQMAVITLGVKDLQRSRRFYVDGFGWKPAMDTSEVVFFQMNGFVLGLWADTSLAEDAARQPFVRPGPYALAHNVPAKEDVQLAMDQLLAHGGSELRAASAPEHGGYRGYVADPDDHTWEIAWNPAWPIDDEGHVKFVGPE